MALHRARVTVDDRTHSLLAPSDAVLEQPLLSCEDGSTDCAHQDEAGQPRIACIMGSDHRRITRHRVLVIRGQHHLELQLSSRRLRLPLRGVAAAHHRQNLPVCHLAGHEHSAIRTIFHGPV